ncbi:hypothetical protein GF371_02080 [Candidatus Woesearchaeota archaeon]|nr:hypothetical protein [Candidatus Woesearchaeota archaeon]
MKTVPIVFLLIAILVSGCTQEQVVEDAVTIQPDCTGCLGDQTCVAGECVDPTCSECQYIENHICVDYGCCTNLVCDDNNPKTEDVCLNPTTKASKCENTKIITNLCEDYYSGEVCDGFCFADLTWQCEVQNGKRVEQQGDLNIEMTFPQYVNANSEYTLTFKLENKGTGTAEYNIKKIQTGDLDTFINKDYTIASGETKEVKVKALAPSNPGFQKSILLYSGDIQSMIYMHLIVIDPNKAVLNCGDKKYNKEYAICKDGVLYPTLYPSCYDDSDCTKYPDKDKCLANTCYLRGGAYKDWEDREYEVEVIPLYINVRGSSSEPNKISDKQKIDKSIKKLNEWFLKEKDFWGFAGDFNIKWSSADYCTFNNIDEFVDLMEETGDQNKLYSAIRERCGDLNKDMHGVYYIWSTGTPGSDSEFDRYKEAKKNYVKSAGQSLDDGKVFVFYPDTLTILHETLHGFGADDLYHYDDNFESTGYGQYYQWNDCLVFNQNPQASEWEKETMPHLCVLEAEAIGIAT